MADQLSDQIVSYLWDPGISIRRAPAIDDGNVCDWAVTGDRHTIVGGPKRANGIWWWQIASAKCDGEGWVAQTRSNGDPILANPKS
jgi:hypothetical protein